MTSAHRLPTLDGTRVVLRALDDGDVDALFRIFGHPEVARYWSSPALADRTGAAELLESIRRHAVAGDLYQWGIATRDDDAVIGTCTLADIDRDNRRADIGFALAREHWGQGLAAEALTCLLEHAFDGMDLRRVEADVDPRNEPSLRVLERLGFEREGYLRQRWEIAGEVQDSVILGLLGDDWRRRAR